MSRLVVLVLVVVDALVNLSLLSKNVEQGFLVVAVANAINNSLNSQGTRSTGTLQLLIHSFAHNHRNININRGQDKVRGTGTCRLASYFFLSFPIIFVIRKRLHLLSFFIFMII